MADFKLNQPVKTEEPSVEVTVNPENPLAIGVHRFQLVVTDSAGNESKPAFVEVTVRDTQLPTAVLDVVEGTKIEYGKSFTLEGKRSADVPPGKIAFYEWTLVPDAARPRA